MWVALEFDLANTGFESDCSFFSQHERIATDTVLQHIQISCIFPTNWYVEVTYNRMIAFGGCPLESHKINNFTIYDRFLAGDSNGDSHQIC